MSRTAKNVTPAEVHPEAVALPQDFGSFTERLSQPERVGVITATQALEIRARNELLKQLDTEALRANRLTMIARNEKLSYVKQLISEQGLNLRDEYNVDDESGVISLTARFVERPAVVEPVEAATEE